MIILPDKNIARAKVLMPQRRLAWDQPSQRRNTFGIENQTRFRLIARLNDGHIYWRGWFDDRDDADAFLWALIRCVELGEPIPHDIQRLPDAWWFPDFLDLGLAYKFATVTFLTSTSASNQTRNVPSDWNSANNTIEGIGGGGGGNTSSGSAEAGGGGAYAKTNNLALSAGGTATFFLNANSGADTNGADTWYSNTGSSPGSTSQGMLAKGAGRPSGGASGSCVGNTTFSGGDGGAANAASNGGSGGGGAAGLTGAG
jgi:hypothetical protein